MQQETITIKRKMQDLTTTEQTEAIADMETIIEAEARQREENEAYLQQEKQWASVRVSLNPRAYNYVKGKAQETGKPIRRVCTDIVQAEAEAHTDDINKGAGNNGE